MFIRYWNRKLSKKSYNLDSERYMAKVCAYLCRQCRFIDGEFGEYVSDCYLTLFLLTYTLTAATLDGVLLYVNVRNLLHCCVKQWVHVDLTSGVLECHSECA